jgi:hypothetical protein
MIDSSERSSEPPVDNLPPAESVTDASEASPSKASPSEPPPSYVKLAMRNMVRKGRQSLVHFTLTVIGLLALMVGLAYLTR